MAERLARLKQWARSLKRQVMVLWFALRHPDMPWQARMVALLVVGYALSPVDLIPDFIPVLGYLDDLILLPLGIWLALRLTPPEVLAATHREADAWLAEQGERPVSYVAAVIVVLLWLALLAGVWWGGRGRWW